MSGDRGSGFDRGPLVSRPDIASVDVTQASKVMVFVRFSGSYRLPWLAVLEYFIHRFLIAF